MTVLMRQRQIDDGQHHENERLQRNDQKMKNSPAQTDHELAEPGDRRTRSGGPSQAQREQRDQNEDQLTGIHIAEQTQTQRDGLGQLLDTFQYEVEPG